MSDNFDIIVIGGGPGGYVCAIRAAQLGLKTACVESRGTLGGTCLNVGCIPSKSLLNLSENYHKVKKDFSKQGIEVSDVKLNVKKMMSNKEKSVQILTKGVEFLFKKNKVSYLKGKGVIFSPTNVVVYDQGKKSSFNTKNIVIATGSSPTTIPGVKIDEKNIISSTAALSLNSVPKSLVVIGGGYIGLEMGSVWKRLGADVTVIENLPYITPGMDREISNEFQKILTKQGINFKLNSKVITIEDQGSEVKIEYQNNEKTNKETIIADKTLIAVGRKPYTEGLNLNKVGIKKDDKGRIKVNKNFRQILKTYTLLEMLLMDPC